jgi:hypothetical protein
MLATVATVVCPHKLAVGVLVGVLPGIFFACKIAQFFRVTSQISPDGRVRTCRVRGQLFNASVEHVMAAFGFREAPERVELIHALGRREAPEKADLSGAILEDARAIVDPDGVTGITTRLRHDDIAEVIGEIEGGASPLFAGLAVT